MLALDWAEKSFVFFCPIGEQQLLSYFGVFSRGHCCMILFWIVLAKKVLKYQSIKARTITYSVAGLTVTVVVNCNKIKYHLYMKTFVWFLIAFL